MDYMTLFAAAKDNSDNGWFNISAPWLALFGTIFGGVGLKIVETWLNKPSRRDSTPAELREELRLQVEGLKSDVIRLQQIIDTTEAEMLVWRDKYYNLLRESATEHQQMLNYLSELTALREQIKDREKHVRGNK